MRYRVWQSGGLHKVDRALLRVIIEAWRADRAIDRDSAEFELVQQGYAYRDVQRSYDFLDGNTFIRTAGMAGEPRGPLPNLRGLVEDGGAASEADLDVLASLIEALRSIYRPEHKRVSLEEVCQVSELSPKAVRRLAGFTAVYDGDAFALGNHVLGWSSFEEFLRVQLPRRAAPVAPEPRRAPLALRIELLPNVVSWSNLGPYQDAVLELAPLTVLIGANASGKTSALRVLDLLSELCEAGLDVLDVDARGENLDPSSSLGLVRRGSPELSFCVAGELYKRGRVWTRCQWSADLLWAPRAAVRRELFELADQRPAAELHFGIGHWSGEGGPQDVHLRPNQLALREVEDVRYHAELIAMRQSLQGWRILLEEPDDDELLSLLDDVDVGRLQDLVSAVLGPVRLRRAGRQLLSVQRDGYTVSLVSGPRGLRHVVTVLAHLLQPTPPALLAFDEIENHLHADVAERLIEVLRGFTHRTRIVVTTHSGNILRAVSPEEVRLVRPGERFSSIVRVDRDPALSRLAKSGSMAELLEGGFLTVTS